MKEESAGISHRINQSKCLGVTEELKQKIPEQGAGETGKEPQVK